MIALMRKARRRSWLELAMLGAAVAARLSALVLLRLVRVATLQKRGTWIARTWARGDVSDATRDRTVAWAVATAAVLLPVDDSCLADALVAHWLLTACGRPSAIRFGVTRTATQAFRAHAWVEGKDAVVIVGAAPPPTFAVLEHDAARRR